MIGDWENKKSMIENVTANLTEAVQDQGPDQLTAPLKVCFKAFKWMLKALLLQHNL